MPDDIEPCPACGGAGYIEDTYKDVYLGRVPIEKLCRWCGGGGQVGPVEARAIANRSKKKRAR